MPLRENEFMSVPITRLKLFTPQECELLLSQRFPQGRDALVQRPDLSNGVDTGIRSATRYRIEPAPASHWIWERIGPMFHDLNQRYFNFALEQLSPLAVMEYKAGDFYDSHIDLGMGAYSCRKLSCVVFLTPPENYTGGRLLFGLDGTDAVTREQGAAVVFPSYLIHQVEPIQSGLRHTLVCWALGDAFR